MTGVGRKQTVCISSNDCGKRTLQRVAYLGSIRSSLWSRPTCVIMAGSLKRRLDPHEFERGQFLLQAFTPCTELTILSDGADGPRSLGEAASIGPTSHVLDWFHLAMRIQHVAQAVKAWPDNSNADRQDGARFADAVEHVRWRLWHGQVQRALDLIGDTVEAFDAVAAVASPAGATAGKVVKLLRDLETYVAGQSELIIDYAAARLDEEPISTAPTEGTVQWLLHRRMGANQQMRWSPRGAHMMLKLRTAVANCTLVRDYAVAERWARRPFRRAA
jgi:hypothetical protein